MWQNSSWLKILTCWPLTTAICSSRPGFMAFSEITNSFWAIPFDWDKLRASNYLQCVGLVETNRLMSSMAFSSQVKTLTSGQISNLIFLRHTWFHAAQQGKDVGVSITIMSLLSHKLFQENDFGPFGQFWSFLDLGSYTVCMRSNLTAYKPCSRKVAIVCFSWIVLATFGLQARASKKYQN